MKSKILEALLAATGLKIERGEGEQELYLRLVHAVHGLDDKGWDSLDEASQDWFNNAADAKNAKKPIEAFPDLEKEETTSRRRPAAEAETTTRRRGAEPEVYEPKNGDMVVIKTKRGAEATGKVVEVTKDIIAIDDGKEEVEFQLERVDTITQVGPVKEETTRRRSAESPPAKEAAEPAVGDVVRVKTKRGAVYEGKLVELDDKGGVLVDKDGKDQEFDHDRVAEFEVVGAKEEPASSGRRTRGAADDKKDEAKDDGKHTKISTKANGGISVTQRMRELMVDQMGIAKDDLAKILKKEGLQFREPTLDVVYADVNRVFALLREAKLLK